MENKLKVCMISSEVEPFAKSGGLGDVVGALPKALNKNNVDCIAIMPLYSQISNQYRKDMKYLGYIYVDLNWRHQYCGIFSYKLDNTTFYFIDNEFYYKHSKLYDNMDLEKFSFLDLASFEVLKFLNFKPDIIHIHDWQTGPVALLLEAKYKHEDFFSKTKVVYTIHNLQYQGKFEKGHVLDILPIDGSYYGYDNIVNFMKLGIVYSAKVTTVSPTYKEEIKTSYYGEGLSDMLNYYSFKLDGILNGIDLKTYSSYRDKNIYKRYSYKNYKEGKLENKKYLLDTLGLDGMDKPLVSIISRLATQKGLNLILEKIDEILSVENINLILLGSGDKELENAFRNVECKYPNKFRAILKFDSQLSHQIYASSDLFLMPSAFEPCGLSQLISLRYQTVPLVRSCGGLKDSIIPFNEYTLKGNGFSFDNFDSNDFYNTLKYAIHIYYNKDLWNKIIDNGHKYSFSWNLSAKRYIKTYKEAIDNE